MLSTAPRQASPVVPSRASCRRRARARAGCRGRNPPTATPSRRSWPAPRGGARAWPSEALRDPGGLERVLAVRTGHLAAEPRRGHQLSGVRQAIRVEGTAQLLERGQVGLAELLGHVALLVHAHAVLARDRAAL